jgi:hypothetical protein
LQLPFTLCLTSALQNGGAGADEDGTGDEGFFELEAFDEAGDEAGDEPEESPPFGGPEAVDDGPALLKTGDEDGDGPELLDFEDDGVAESLGIGEDFKLEDDGKGPLMLSPPARTFITRPGKKRKILEYQGSPWKID